MQRSIEKKAWNAPTLERLDVEETLTGMFANLPEGFLGQPGNVPLGCGGGNCGS